MSRENNTSTLYIMCGLPFSGKTYLSKKIAYALSCERISYDELWQLKKNELGRSIEWEELSSISNDIILHYLNHNKSVVFDTLNDTYAYRTTLQQLAYSINARSVIIYLDTPFNIIETRRSQNVISNARHQVEDQQFNEAICKFEVPKSNENVIIFKSGMMLKDLIPLITTIS